MKKPCGCKYGLDDNLEAEHKHCLMHQFGQCVGIAKSNSQSRRIENLERKILNK